MPGIKINYGSFLIGIHTDLLGLNISERGKTSYDFKLDLIIYLTRMKNCKRIETEQNRCTHYFYTDLMNFDEILQNVCTVEYKIRSTILRFSDELPSLQIISYTCLIGVKSGQRESHESRVNLRAWKWPISICYRTRYHYTSRKDCMQLRNKLLISAFSALNIKTKLAENRTLFHSPFQIDLASHHLKRARRCLNSRHNFPYERSPKARNLR